MSEVEQLLVEIGKGMGRSAEQMKPFVTKLEEQWYDTKDSLKGIDDDTWKTLGLPARLIDEIKKAIGTGGAAAAPVAVAPAPAAAQAPVPMQVDSSPQASSSSSSSSARAAAPTSVSKIKL